MKLSAVIATFATVVLAAPTSEVASLDKRAVTWVYLCTDINWNGDCKRIPADSGLCVPLASDLNDRVSSAGPDNGNWCTFYVDSNCQGDSFSIGYPGYADLRNVNGKDFNDKTSSYSCISN